MERNRTLREALFEAQEKTIKEMEALTRELETEQKLTPQQALDRAWEMIREKYPLRNSTCAPSHFEIAAAK